MSTASSPPPSPDTPTDGSLSDDIEAMLRERWWRSLRLAWSAAKVERRAQLDGFRARASFDSQGIHSYSHHWGEAKLIEALLPDLEEVRRAHGVDPVSMRTLAQHTAERAFALDYLKKAEAEERGE